MQIQTIKTEELRVAEYNPRKKSQHVLETVKASLKEYGFLQPIVINIHQCELCGDRRNVIVGGHRRIDAAREAGILAARYQNNPVKRLLEIHEKVLTFFKGDPEQIAETFIAPPNIIRDPIPHEPNPEDSAE